MIQMGVADDRRAVAVVGRDAVLAFNEVRKLHFWKMTAGSVVKFGMRPSQGATVAMFNEAYGTRLKTWKQVGEAAEKMIQGSRES